MNKRFFVSILSISVVLGAFMYDSANAAARTAVRSAPTSARKSVNATAATVQEEKQPVKEEAVQETESEPEEPIIVNKSAEFESTLLDVATSSSSSSSDNTFAEQIRKQKAALAASEATADVKASQQAALRDNANTCDRGLRKCMMETCGNDFTKCALDGDTDFGDKLNKCRNSVTCTGEEFRLFTTEIKADRDMNARLASYERVINCGNEYNACIVNECGTTYNKCLGKQYADAAIKKCANVAKDCTESDSGLASRFGTAIGMLRENAEKEVKKDENRLYELRDLMRTTCESLGAMFDERSFDCVYTVNFFAGENQDTPTASRKRYAGDSFICMQEWFGINATTFKENAYRETRSQTAASSAMLGSGLGTAAGLISSGAIDRAVDTQKAKKALDKERVSQGMDTVDTEKRKEDKALKDAKKQERQAEKDKKATECADKGGEYKLSACYCGNIIMTKNATCNNGKIDNPDLKKKGMVCTAEYNKQHPNDKVALATYDEKGNCTADAGRKKDSKKQPTIQNNGSSVNKNTKNANNETSTSTVGATDTTGTTQPSDKVQEIAVPPVQYQPNQPEALVM